MSKFRVSTGNWICTPKERKIVNDILDSGKISEGPYMKKFSKLWADYIGTPYCTTLNSGTSALIVGLRALNYKLGRFIKVLTTPFTYIATVNSIYLTGNTPVFCDIERERLGLDPQAVERKLQEDPEIDAVLLVHIMGIPSRVDEISDICRKYGVLLLEDNCLVKGTKIFANKTLKNIEDMKKGDLVLTHKGRWKKVLRVFKRKIKDDVIHIKFYYNREGVKATKEHPFYVLRDGKKIWARADDLRLSDKIIYAKEKFDNISIKNEISWLDENNQKEVIVPNEDFYKLCGLYIAEGHTSKNGIVFSLNENERDLVDFIFKFAKNINRSACEINDKRNGGTQVKIPCRPLANIFKKLFGHGAKNKKIPDGWESLPSRYLYSLLEGYLLGDGYLNKKRLHIATASKKLYSQLIRIMNNLNIFTQLYETEGEESIIRGKKVKSGRIYHILCQGNTKEELYKNIHQDSYKTRKSFGDYDDEYLYIPIRSLDTVYYEGYVYNIEVEDDNSYSLPMCTTHNCQAYGTEYKGKMLGSYGLWSACSFFIAHTIQVSEMGTLNTYDRTLFRYFDKLKSNGRTAAFDRELEKYFVEKVEEDKRDLHPRYYHDMVSGNYRTQEFSAGIACAQFEKIDEIIKKRNENVKYLLDNLVPKYGNILQFPIYDEKIAYLGFPMVIKNPTIERRWIREEFEKKGIETRPMYGCLPLDMPSFEHLRNEYKMKLPASEDIGRNAWYIGCHQYLTKKDLDYIISVFDEVLKKHERVAKK